MVSVRGHPRADARNVKMRVICSSLPTAVSDETICLLHGEAVIGAAALVREGQVHGCHVTMKLTLSIFVMFIGAQDEATADELALSETLLLPLSAAFDFSSSEA